MKSYIAKIFAALAVIMIAHVTIILTVPSIIAAEYWMRETIVVKESISSTLPSPRIIFLAGSSAMFGIDAKKVELATGIPSINMGLEGSMQLSSILKIGDVIARAGDVMVVPLERGYYGCGQNSWTPWLLRNSLAWDREHFDSLPLQRRVEIVLSQSDPGLAFEIAGDFVLSSAFPQLYQRRLAAIAPPKLIMERFRSGAERPGSFAYSAFNLDERGTMLHTKGSFTVDPGTGVSALYPAAICPDTLRILGQFVARMKARNVRVIFSHEPYMIETQPEKGWPQSEVLFARDIHSIGSELLEGRQMAFFPRSDFFNYLNHLNEAARDRHTAQIIADLKRLGIYRK